MKKIRSNFNFRQWLEQNGLEDSGCKGMTWGKRLRKLRGDGNGKGILMHSVENKTQKTQSWFVVFGSLFPHF